MKKFALIGVAGYVAPKHIQAIDEVGGELVAALDPHDSVGILDSYFPRCLYFREPERFDRWLSKHPVDYVSVCSPNYLHDSHCLMAMRNGADVICEKPLVLNERNLDNLLVWEDKTGKRVNVILQCRLHHEVLVASTTINPFRVQTIDIDYCTPRGAWYQQSWKGDVAKSGGLATNIGIHLFDLVACLAGPIQSPGVNNFGDDFVSGYSELRYGAEMTWRLSVEIDKPPKRVFKLDDTVLDLTNGFGTLHTESYKRILRNDGYGIEDIRSATIVVEEIRRCLLEK